MHLLLSLLWKVKDTFATTNICLFFFCFFQCYVCFQKAITQHINLKRHGTKEPFLYLGLI